MTGVSPFSIRWAAAASPIGPAPMTATGSLPGSAFVATVCRPAPLATALGDWQPQVAAGSEQQAPVAGFGVGSPQHADAVAVVSVGGDTSAADAVLPQQLAAAAPAEREGVGVMAISSLSRAGAQHLVRGSVIPRSEATRDLARGPRGRSSHDDRTADPSLRSG